MLWVIVSLLIFFLIKNFFSLSYCSTTHTLIPSKEILDFVSWPSLDPHASVHSDYLPFHDT